MHETLWAQLVRAMQPASWNGFAFDTWGTRRNNLHALRDQAVLFLIAPRRRVEIAYTLVQAGSGSRGLNQVNVMSENRLFSFRIHRDLRRPAELTSAAKELSAL